MDRQDPAFLEALREARARAKAAVAEKREREKQSKAPERRDFMSDKRAAHSPRKAGSVMGNSPSSIRRLKMSSPNTERKGDPPAVTATTTLAHKSPMTKDQKDSIYDDSTDDDLEVQTKSHKAGAAQKNDDDSSSSSSSSTDTDEIKPREAEGDKEKLLEDSRPQGTLAENKDSTAKLVSDESHETSPVSDKEKLTTLEDNDNKSKEEKHTGASKADNDSSETSGSFISAREGDVSGSESGGDENSDEALLVDKVPPSGDNPVEDHQNNNPLDEQDTVPVDVDIRAHQKIPLEVQDAAPMDVDTSDSEEEVEATKDASKSAGDGAVGLGSVTSLKNASTLAVENDNLDNGIQKSNLFSNSAEQNEGCPDDDQKPKARKAALVPPINNETESLQQSPQGNSSRERSYSIKASKRTGTAKRTEGTGLNKTVDLTDSSDDIQDKSENSNAAQGNKEASLSEAKNEGSKLVMANQEELSERGRTGSSEPQVVCSADENSNGKANDSTIACGKGKLRRDLEVGERVYAEFPENRDYYWGKVQSMQESKIKRARYKYTYNVLFDDGDVGKYIHRTKIFTQEDKDLQELLEVEAGEGKDSNSNNKYGAVQAEESGMVKGRTLQFDVLSCKDILELACRKCERCKRKDCGECGACKANRFGKDISCCFHKICNKIPKQQKLQTLKHLPKDVAFCFSDPESNPDYDGLVIYTKGGRSYRSIEKAFCSKDVDTSKAYRYLGLVAETPKDSEEADRVDAQNDDQNDVLPFTPRQLFQNRCKRCSNCVKASCGKCVCCKGNTARPGDAKNCCYQKMCLEIPVSRKAQPANNGFPSADWKFYFGEPRQGFDNMQGLVIIPPNKQHTYNSVEKCVKHCYKKLANVDIALFYKYVGLTGQDEPAAGRKRYSEAEEGSLGHTKKARIGTTGFSPRKLYDRRCGNCLMCFKPSCGRCLSCRDNKGQTRAFRDVCFQKMCCKIEPADKAQPAKGLPEGWTFYYTTPQELPWAVSTQHTGLAGFVLQSPDGKKYPTVEEAETAISEAVKYIEATREFYNHIGCHAIVKLRDHVLLGKEWKQSWVDVEGNKKVVYGRISEVEDDQLSSKLRFTVELNETSRALVNAGFSVNGTVASKTLRDIEERTAFGGCFAVNPNVVQSYDMPFFHSYLVPEMRHEAAIFDEQDMLTPQLTLQFRGYHLVFTAKTSTIPNAGKGVFLTCKSLFKGRDKFELRPGELLDMGVYAPFRPEDHKKSHLFLFKNYIHGQICEEWSFDTPNDDYVFDITDDVTGELESLASCHIPAYVNETDGQTPPSIFSTHDPQGCVHYMLGYHQATDKAFTIRADGKEEKELFIDYGEIYEDPRIRKNYSRLPPDEAALKQRYMESGGEDLEILDNLLSYSASEIEECVDFLNQKVFVSNSHIYKASTVVRSLIATVLFRKRAEGLLHEFDQYTGSLEDVCLNGFHTTVMNNTIQKTMTLTRRIFESCNSWAQIKQKIVSTPVFFRSLKFVLGEKDYHSMSPAEFGAQITGHS